MVVAEPLFHGLRYAAGSFLRPRWRSRRARRPSARGGAGGLPGGGVMSSEIDRHVALVDEFMRGWGYASTPPDAHEFLVEQHAGLTDEQVHPAVVAWESSNERPEEDAELEEVTRERRPPAGRPLLCIARSGRRP